MRGGKCQGVGCVKYMHAVNNQYFYGVINFNNYLDFFFFFGLVFGFVVVVWQME